MQEVVVHSYSEHRHSYSEHHKSSGCKMMSWRSIGRMVVLPGLLADPAGGHWDQVLELEKSDLAAVGFDWDLCA